MTVTGGPKASPSGPTDDDQVSAKSLSYFFNKLQQLAHIVWYVGTSYQPSRSGATGEEKRMPTPRQPDPPAPTYLLPCPKCIKSMRIKTVEIADGREQFTLICDTCKTEACYDSPTNPA